MKILSIIFILFNSILISIAGTSTFDKINISGTIQLNYTIDSLGCDDFEGQIFLDITGEYEELFWIGPNSYFSFEQNPVVHYPGLYIVKVADVNGCEVQDTVNMEYNHAAFNMDVSTNQTISCEVPEVEIIVSPGGTDFSYDWNKINDISFNAPDNDSITIVEGGWYSVEITRLSDNCTVRELSLIFTDTISPHLSYGSNLINGEGTYVYDCEVGNGLTTITSDLPGMFNVITPSGMVLDTVFTNEYILEVTEIGVYIIEINIDNGCSDQLFLTTECTSTEMQCIGTSLYGDGIGSFENTDAPITEEIIVEFGDCRDLCISLDVSTNGSTWDSTGDLETIQECSFGNPCIGNPFNSLQGDCNGCWDFLYVQFKVGDSVVYKNILGDEPDDALDASWSATIKASDFPDNSNVIITIIGQTFATNEQLSYSNLSVTCLQDLDEDGYFEADDCDDNNPEFNPGIVEICDGIDNNCNGQVDEGFILQMYFSDNDMDGYGAG